LHSSGKHFIKAAVTGKYLAGIASLNMSSANLQLSVNDDSSINFNATNVNYNHSRNADFNMVFDKSFRPDATSFGFDAGIVYEYRGNLNKFKYFRNDDETSYEADRRDVNKYIFKLGVSLLDAGMFRFDKADNVSSFSANVTNWNLANGRYNTIKAFDTALANRVVANADDPRSYNVYLPSALSVQMDLKFIKGFYLNAMIYQPVRIGSSAGTRFSNYGFYTITPRWESRHIGVYLPYTITEKNPSTNFRQNMLGATLRLGPLFVGSSNLATMAFNKRLSAADVHIGLKVGITYGKPNKSSAYLQKIFSRKQHNDSIAAAQWVYTKPGDTVFVQRNDSSRLLIDYAKGKIYDVPNAKGNIVIVNNNYYYNTAPPVAGKAVDTIVLNNRISLQTDSFLTVQNKLSIDSIRKLQNDSLKIKKQQLDSLIKEMQQLQIQMDSARLKDGSGNYNPALLNLKNMLDSEAFANRKWIDSATVVNELAYNYQQQSLADSISQPGSHSKKKIWVQLIRQ